jgi:ubiquinone/menaquinone biosynthesis C-methylase UbiE
MSLPSFDERATTWDDDPGMRERAELFATAIRAAVPLDRSVQLLEYGAGTGLVTQALRDVVGPVTLADSSAGMREVIATKIAAGAIPDARVWEVDLSTDPVPDEEFDVVVTVLALHHVVELEPVLSAFAALLTDGGHLGIVDFDEEDGSLHGEGFVGHHGFDRDALRVTLEQTGFADVRFDTCHQIVKGDVAYPVFLATCRRPVD